MNLYREATRDEIAIDDLGVVSAVDVYTMDVVEITEPLLSRAEWEATIEKDFKEGGPIPGPSTFVLMSGERMGLEHKHQFLPWLTLPNGSSWTGCASCDWQYQYDH